MFVRYNLKLYCMKITYVFLGAVLLLFISCSPKVVTNLVRTYPDVVPTDSVLVIELGEKVPNSAETIGRVSVSDRGTSTNCRYDQVLHLAKEVTGKAGGNGLAITDHLEPSLWGSSCHQITGLMLRLGDREVDTLRANPVQDIINLDQAIVKDRRARQISPSNTFEVNIGYGWITSTIYDSYGYKLGHKGGVEWKLAYDHVWKSGLGVGVQYSGFNASFPGGNMLLSYIAPEFLGRSKIDKWILKYGLGVGLFVYNDPYYSTAGLGTHVVLGVEYMLTKNIGLGMSANCVAGYLPRQEGVNLPDNESSGIGRFNLLGGLRFYF